MAIVSVDLAFKRHENIGIAVMRAAGRRILCDLVAAGDIGLRGEPEPAALAKALDHLARVAHARLILIDGPQAWAPEAGRMRACERALCTPGKTGLPGVGKPAGYLPFIQFSITLFDQLHELGWPRLLGPRLPPARRCAVESFPTAAWKALGLPPLPAKAKMRTRSLTLWTEEIEGRFGVRMNRPPGHDELQAVVAGLSGLAFESGEGYEVVGLPPLRRKGSWREGFILIPGRTQLR